MYFTYLVFRGMIHGKQMFAVYMREGEDEGRHSGDWVLI